jgi:hypothetical protein
MQPFGGCRTRMAAFSAATASRASIERLIAYVRFVQAVLAELKIDLNGKTYSPESITRALRSRFGEQPRIRRKTNERPDYYAFWRIALLRKEMGLAPPTPPAEPQAGFYGPPIENNLGGQNSERKGISAQES